MCGIIGYSGFRNASRVIPDCLKRLEYRGYDSAGIAVSDNGLKVIKDVGDISHLKEKIPISSTSRFGIGHTRWATHGQVNLANAHPHVDCDNKIAIVHNGIIENFISIKEELKNKGCLFNTNTDSEVIAHLIEKNYKGNLEDALIATLKKLKGSYAIVAICVDEPDKIVGARKESPLVIGVGDNENFIASDLTALLKYTNRVIFLEDGEICVVSSKSISIFDENKNSISRDEQFINWDIKDAKKSGFSHFMLKEIFEQPQSIQQTLLGRISELDLSIVFPSKVESLLKKPINSIHIIACGTSFYSGLIGKIFIEKLIEVPVYVDIASEYRYNGLIKKNTLVIAITQSGETADTLAALRKVKNSGCSTLVITNVIGSTATRIADAYLLTQCGPEIGVAATKTFTSQIIMLYLIALSLAFQNGNLTLDELSHHIQSLKKIPGQVSQLLERNDAIADIAKELSHAQSVFFIGRGANYPLALEGALKLKEISYIHAEGFAAGEIKHGPFALLSKETPIVAIINEDQTYNKMITNIGEVKARGSPVIAIASENDTEIEKHADIVIRTALGDDIVNSSIMTTIVLQLLAYHVARLRGKSIDKPRNLAKSVTVD